jgi:hypothetical protein
MEALMSTTLSETEAAPASWPTLTVDGLDAAGAAAVWRRIEAFTAWRFTARTQVCIAEGPGCWRPRLRPFTVTLTEAWGDGWAEVTLAPEPLGGVMLPGAGPYRVTATIGSGVTVPEDVAEAARRLGAYQVQLAASDPAQVREEIAVGELRLGNERAVAWAARALQLSGAADLLRPYRNLGSSA